MKRSLHVAGAFLLASVCVGAELRMAAQDAADKSQAAADDYKISPEDIARKNPIKTTPEGLAEARRAFKYDCAMCHGAAGDGKGEIVESMQLTMRDWRDPATLQGKSDGEIFYMITKGKGKMTGEGDRQPEKLRWNMVNLVRSMAAKGAQAKAPAVGGAGAKS